jgi:hypothetical protein
MDLVVPLLPGRWKSQSILPEGTPLLTTGLQSTGAVGKKVGKLVVLAFQGAELSSVG